ncbi:MAG: RNA-directed DNA polymerase [Peptococcaceae bacterium]|nr:RNA-directed DNA polymerase [Peptococcaceae bacterium]
MGWSGLERNKLDYILTDLLPAETSELFSFSQLYSYLLQKDNQKKVNDLIHAIKKTKASGDKAMFKKGWSTKPLKYKILKGSDSMREMSIIQPFSALNLFLFIECYQNDILDYFEKHHNFSIRYHRKNPNLYYKAKVGHITQYFQDQSYRAGRKIIQQSGNYFKITPFESINSFSDSRIWRISNLKYKYYAKLDYKACFDSIYTHAFTWILERNVIDAKNAENSNLFITIDRILQNINGRSSNGIVVGPEFSRMMAEILLQHIDCEIALALSKENIFFNVDYVAFRYVDDIFLFSNDPHILDQILLKYKTIGEHYLLRLNELKLLRGNTPCLPKEWLEKTRQLSDVIGGFFHQWTKNDYDKLPKNEQFLIKSEYIPVDRVKDEITVLIKKYPKDKHTIVSFLLSTLLNNISKKNDGYTLFCNQRPGKALLLIDLAFYIYAFYPSFDQTRKMISLISYINSEMRFKDDAAANIKLCRIINRYSFIFHFGNIFDLCDWFPFFREYNIVLDAATENHLIEVARNNNDPIIWANLLLYSQYYQPFFEKLLKELDTIINKQIDRISSIEPMMHLEFWYLLIFHNCPYISETLSQKMTDIIADIKSKVVKKQDMKPSDRVSLLICDFLELYSINGKKPSESLFNWNGVKNFSDQVTYRTYQRTIFKNYRKKAYWLYASLN